MFWFFKLNPDRTNLSEYTNNRWEALNENSKLPPMESTENMNIPLALVSDLDLKKIQLKNTWRFCQNLKKLQVYNITGVDNAY